MSAAQMYARPDPDERREVEALICDLPEGRPGDRAFDEPWEIRAFALAVAAHRTGQYEWSQFQNALIAAIKEWEDNVPSLDDSSWSYYAHWVSALETVLAETRALDSENLSQRTAEVLATPPNRNHHQAHLEPVAIDPRR